MCFQDIPSCHRFPLVVGKQASVIYIYMLMGNEPRRFSLPQCSRHGGGLCGGGWSQTVSLSLGCTWLRDWLRGLMMSLGGISPTPSPPQPGCCQSIRGVCIRAAPFALFSASAIGAVFLLFYLSFCSLYSTFCRKPGDTPLLEEFIFSLQAAFSSVFLLIHCCSYLFL